MRLACSAASYLPSHQLQRPATGPQASNRGTIVRICDQPRLPLPLAVQQGSCCAEGQSNRHVFWIEPAAAACGILAGVLQAAADSWFSPELSELAPNKDPLLHPASYSQASSPATRRPSPLPCPSRPHLALLLLLPYPTSTYHGVHAALKPLRQRVTLLHRHQHAAALPVQGSPSSTAPRPEPSPLVELPSPLSPP